MWYRNNTTQKPLLRWVNNGLFFLGRAGVCGLYPPTAPVAWAVSVPFHAPSFALFAPQSSANAPYTSHSLPRSHHQPCQRHRLLCARRIGASFGPLTLSPPGRISQPRTPSEGRTGRGLPKKVGPLPLSCPPKRIQHSTRKDAVRYRTAQFPFFYYAI